MDTSKRFGKHTPGQVVATSKNRIGIVQGRLSPPVDGKLQAFPRDSWVEEFPKAQAVGLDGIEWVYDAKGEKENPLNSPEGISRILALSKKFHVGVRSLCADYLLERPLLRVLKRIQEERLKKLFWLLQACSKAEIRRVVLPFVDDSEIRTDRELDEVVSTLQSVLPWLEDLGIELDLETSLPPSQFQRLLQKLHHPLIKVNYDIGNSASLGYDTTVEFEAYGERIGSVHVKDRLKGGHSVPLGKGAADFSLCFLKLEHLGYEGDFILQVARGKEGEEAAWAMTNRQFVLSYWNSR